MSGPTDDVAQRRAVLIDRIERDRAAVADAFGELRGRTKVADVLMGAVRRANRHRALTGALAVLAVVAPFTARTWLRRAAWFLPLAFQGLRFFRGERDRERDE